MPASGNYFLRIAPASAGATCKQTTINKYTNKAGRFDGHPDAAVQYRVHGLMGGSRALLKANGCHHRASTRSNSMQLDIPTPVLSDVFHRQIIEKATQPRG
jgi:hypothetical protein